MRELFPFGLLAIACGAAADPMACARPAAVARSPATTANATAAALAAPDAGGDPFASLAARAPLLAPGMREAARRQSTGGKVDLVVRPDRDTCVRVAFDATEPVVAKLVDARGDVLAATDAAAIAGALGARGPVCVRKGDSVVAIADGVGAQVRWIAWAAP